MLVWLLMLLSIIAVWFMIPDALGEKKEKANIFGTDLRHNRFCRGQPTHKSCVQR